MTVIAKTLSICLAVAAFTATPAETAKAASVGVSIHFDVAPVDLVRARGVSPARIRTCENLKNKVGAIWSGKKSSPTLNCRISAQMPLVVTASMLDGEVIARP